jgi:hypothetical protein
MRFALPAVLSALRLAPVVVAQTSDPRVILAGAHCGVNLPACPGGPEPGARWGRGDAT